MEFSIFEIIGKNKKQRSKILKDISEGAKSFKDFLDKLYKFDVMPYYKITKEEAIKINLGERETINAVYFRNSEKFAKSAYRYGENKGLKGGGLVAYVQDVTQQLYIDLRYYDFTSLKSFKDSFGKTARCIDNGGIRGHKAQAREQKAQTSLQAQISAHNSRMEAGEELNEFLADDERKTNPEVMEITKEERAEQVAYSKTMLFAMRENLTPNQFAKIAEVYNVAIEEWEES